MWDKYQNSLYFLTVNYKKADANYAVTESKKQ